MNYLVNDIENFLLLNNMGVFTHIKVGCDSISITNIRINDFSIQMRNRIAGLFPEGLAEVEVDLAYYEFEKSNKVKLAGLGDGDRSSLYQARVEGSTVVTCNDLIHQAGMELNINTVYTEEFVNLFIRDTSTIDYFTNYKIS